jgi:hypothetical protein
MATDGRPRNGSFVFGIILIALGVVFLIAHLNPNFDPWPLLDRYWPFVLIVLGLAQLWDRMRVRNDPQAKRSGWISGWAIALILVVVLVGVSVRKGGAMNPIVHETQTIEKQGQSVVAKIDMPAGELRIDSGSTHLLDADFAFDQASGKPKIDYNLTGTSGRLEISQPSAFHLGRNENTWNLRFGDVPMEMELDMGAGRGDLHLQGLDLSRLKVDMGAGELDINLTGDRKRDLQADVHGGVGEATIHLPRNIGVEIHAEGGLGSIDVVGLRRQGGAYVNDAFGKSPVSIRMNIEGGVGQIRLVQEN